MISPKLLMGWRLLAVSVSLVIFFRFIGSINTSHQVYSISLQILTKCKFILTWEMVGVIKYLQNKLIHILKNW